MTKSQQKVSVETALPITKMLEKRIRAMYEVHKELPCEFAQKSLLDNVLRNIEKLLPQVRQLETKKLEDVSLSIARAKEEERERIVKIIEKMMPSFRYAQRRFAMKDVIERISDNP